MTRPPSGLPRTSVLRLGDITEADLPRFFEWERELEANRIAAFTAKDPSDRAAYMAK